MIVAPLFPGDVNRELMAVQHDVYWEIVGKLYVSARDLYLRSVRVDGVQTELAQQVAAREGGIDHRVLQHAHDLIAGHFRQIRPELLQPELASVASGHRARLERQWREYYGGEVERLAREPLVCQAVVTAIAYTNSDQGYRAEEDLCAFLRVRYSLPSSAEAG